MPLTGIRRDAPPELRNGRNARIGRWVFVLALLPFFFASSAAAGPAFPEGLWEITATMEIPGLDPGLTRPQTYQRCLTGEDPIPREPERDRQCRLLRSSLEGDALTWSVQCTLDRGTMSGRGRVLFQKETLRGVMRARIESDGKKALSVTQRISGRRIGDCTSPMEGPRRSGSPPP
jgi:hypothetical protein